MMETPEIMISGLKLILSLFPEAEGVIGIEDNIILAQLCECRHSIIENHPRIVGWSYDNFSTKFIYQCVFIMF